MIAIVFLPYILRFQASPKFVHFPIKETVEHLAASTYITRFSVGSLSSSLSWTLSFSLLRYFSTITVFFQNFPAGVSNDPGLSIMMDILTNQERIEMNSYDSNTIEQSSF
ncbi:unnamed protein product [Musa acuminata subsp. malaccensis]|uniref:Uncharacterized protein n=1 Tax=Musa acuminata subsp. malaccensis TaxID=214687 RepID=A0A804V5D8_MUSAM|nr:unnamed protein product [Musa acuminata subsp. malaccensis]